MRTALVQSDILWEDKVANFDRVRDYLADTSADLIVLPELFATGFTMAAAEIAEPDLGQTESFLIALAKEKGAHVIGGLAKIAPNGEGKPKNCAVLATPSGEIACRYEKIHPFSYGDEQLHYAAGSQVQCTSIGDWQVCPTVCYDLRFPELYRAGTALAAQLLIAIANWPAKRREHWRTLLQARAIENQAYVIGVNRCGADPNLDYAGDSLAIDPQGTIIADAGCDAGVVTADLNLTEVLDWRDQFPALRDRRDSLFRK